MFFALIYVVQLLKCRLKIQSIYATGYFLYHLKERKKICGRTYRCTLLTCAAMSATLYVESNDGIIVNWEVSGMSTCGPIKVPLSRHLPVGIEGKYKIASQGNRCLEYN